MREGSVRAGSRRGLSVSAVYISENKVLSDPIFKNYKVTPKKNEKCNKSVKWTPNEMKLWETQ